MAAKAKVNAFTGMHTAGIYSDMTVDGPEIGTLVVIVDRAKNLPNRKSMGKQDPYCAARLGKEAKKTETDKRGGQTPKWDQELRFTVHDSPDYYQMKVSVFNDDKKTDLIGETWVSLQDVVVPGGGQNDLWHNLSYRGKYAGEIRIEITYYDSRPKQEKPSDKARQSTTNGVVDGARDSMTGPRQPKQLMKRRPLPSDPTTASPGPVPTPDHIQTPSRGHQPPATYVQTQSPLQAVEYGTPNHRFSQSQQGYKQSPTNLHTYDTSTAKNVGTPPGRPIQDDRYDAYNISGSVEYGKDSVFRYGDAIENQRDGRPRYEKPMDERRPQRSRYDEPVDEYNRDIHPLYKENIDDQRRASRPFYEESFDDQRRATRTQYEDPFDAHRVNSGPRHGSREISREPPTSDEYEPALNPGGPPPPPPPVHRSNITSSVTSNIPISNGAYDSSTFSSIHNPPFDPSRQETYRSSAPAHSENGTYQSYSHKTQGLPEYYEDNGDYQQTQQHHSYEDKYNGSYSSMQPTVEDPTSSPPTVYRQPSHSPSTAHNSQYQDRRYDDVPSPAPLNLDNRRSAASELYNASTFPSQQFYTGTSPTVSPLSYRDPSQVSTEVSSQTSYTSNTSQQGQNLRRSSQDDMRRLSGSYIPSVPPTLVAGMDPIIAQEVSERIYHENRASYTQNAPAEPRGRYPDRPQHRLSYSHPVSEQEAPPGSALTNFVPAASSMVVPFVPAAASYDERQSRIATGTYTPVVKPRAVSPDPRVPARKSVSPSPVPLPQGRGLSGFPFGPDAYDMLNPNISPSATNSGSARPGRQDIEVDAKIIMHDGREVDPSDHLPETSWAPEPEVRTPKQPDTSRSRPSPAGAQPMPPSSARRPLRQAGRPQSMAPVNSSPMYMTGAISDPSTPAPPPGRSRLQKKANRNSIQPAPHSSPLSPMAQYPDNNYPVRSLPRARTVDSTGENGYGSYSSGGSPGGYERGGRGSSSGGPPIPAKVPISQGPPPMPPAENAWALLEEMKSIDLGSGRARRRNYALA